MTLKTCTFSKITGGSPKAVISGREGKWKQVIAGSIKKLLNPDTYNVHCEIKNSACFIKVNNKSALFHLYLKENSG